MEVAMEEDIDQDMVGAIQEDTVVVIQVVMVANIQEATMVKYH